MRLLSASQIVDVWEVGYRLHPIDRALMILAAGYPESEWEDLAALTVGERDAALLAMRRQTFGDTITGGSRCPGCGEQMEFQAAVSDLLKEASTQRNGVLALPEGGEIEFRLPDSRDLAAIVAMPDGENTESVRRSLAERCITRVVEKNERSDGGESGKSSDEDFDEEAATSSFHLSDQTIALLAEAMEECDPLADIQFDLHCPACGREWSVVLDILTCFWEELSREAQGLLRDVHVIASAYGWSQEAILAISPARRKTYIDLIL